MLNCCERVFFILFVVMAINYVIIVVIDIVLSKLIIGCTKYVARPIVTYNWEKFAVAQRLHHRLFR